MNPPKSIVIGYAAIGMCNPVSLDLIDRALEVAGLPIGARALDVGCGNATLAFHMAEDHGFEVEAIERSPAIYDIALSRVAGRGGSGSVALHNVDSKDYLGSMEPFDLLVALGASQLGPNPDPRTILGDLARHVRPGGFVLWGDLFWRRVPDPALAAMAAGQTVGAGHVDNVLAGEAAGLTCWYAGVSSQQDWDDFTWRMAAANQAWLERNSDDPEADAVRAHAGYLRGVYLSLAREALDFGVYLFRKPG